jgi:hypothetical protein
MYVRRGALYAVVVGVSKYKSPKIPRLKCAHKDAEDFAAFLQSRSRLFGKIDLTLLEFR